MSENPNALQAAPTAAEQAQACAREVAEGWQRVQSETLRMNADLTRQQMRVQMIGMASNLAPGKEPATVLELAERIRAFVEEGRAAPARLRAVTGAAEE